MFKGPAALTGASTITANTVTTTGAVSLGSTLAVTGAVTTTAGVTVGNALAVSAGGANITGGATIANGLTVSGGGASITGTLSASGAITATGGITMGSATVTSIERGASTNGDSDIIASKRYVVEQVASASGAAAADTITNSTTKALAPNTTYFISAGSAVNATVTDGTLVDGSLVRFVIDSGTADVVLTAGGALGSTGFQPMSGSDGTTLTLSGIGHSAQFVFHSNTLFAVSGGGTIV
jgi:hypothetical protein